VTGVQTCALPISSSVGGLKEAERAGKDHTPYYAAALVRAKIDRQNNFKQAGEIYRGFEEWEREELIFNLVDSLSRCPSHIQDKMIQMFYACDDDYGRRVEEGIRKAQTMMKETEGAAGDADKAVKQAEEAGKEAKP